MAGRGAQARSMRPDIKPSAPFPDYELPDHDRVTRKLGEIQGEDPMIPHASQEFRASVGAQWPFLEDPGRIVQQDLDIQEYTDPDNDPMIPHTLVLKPGLIVHSIYNGYWFWGRPSMADLSRDLRDVSSESWPDWDLSAPGLREAWDAGDHSPFHGWNKRLAV